MHRVLSRELHWSPGLLKPLEPLRPPGPLEPTEPLRLPRPPEPLGPLRNSTRHSNPDGPGGFSNLSGSGGPGGLSVFGGPGGLWRLLSNYAVPWICMHA